MVENVKYRYRFSLYKSRIFLYWAKFAGFFIVCPSIPFLSLKASTVAYDALQGLIQVALAKLIFYFSLISKHPYIKPTTKSNLLRFYTECWGVLKSTR